MAFVLIEGIDRAADFAARADSTLADEAGESKKGRGRPKAPRPETAKGLASLEIKPLPARANADVHLNRILRAAGMEVVLGYPQDAASARFVSEAKPGLARRETGDFKRESHPSFVDWMRHHMTKLGWKADDLTGKHIPYNLLEAIGARADVEWLTKETRGFGKDEVCRIVCVFLRKYAELNPRAANGALGGFDSFLNEALILSGYQADVGRDIDQKFEQLGLMNTPQEERRLKVGWTKLHPLCFVDSDGNETGVFVEITRKVADYMGVGLDWVECRWEDITRKLRTGEIDVIAPMAIPFARRMFEVSFSQPLPFLRSGLNCVLRSEQVKDVTYSGRPAEDLRDVRLDRLRFEFIPNTMGESGLRHFRSGTHDPPHIARADAGWKALVEGPAGEAGDKVRCFLTGQFMCYNACHESGRRVVPLLPWEKSRAKLPFAYGVSYNEPRMLSIINTCLDAILSEERDWVHETYLKYLDEQQQKWMHDDP